MNVSREHAGKMIQQAQKITFLTGAGISTPSGIPDYRSLKGGLYRGMEAPEYLLSASCLDREPEKFYQFVTQLYHPQAQPNIIHKKIRQLENSKKIHIVTQNIDGLHQKAGSQSCLSFHGSLYECTCLKCHQTVEWQLYLMSDTHQICGGRIRPNIVLYEEGFGSLIVDEAILAVEDAELLVIVGTTFQVHPFCDLVHYKQPEIPILVINQESISLPYPYSFLKEDATRLFDVL